MDAIPKFMRTRAYRRHQRERITAKVRKYFNPHANHKTRKPCSCAMCGHVRFHCGPSLQEKRKQYHETLTP